MRYLFYSFSGDIVQPRWEFIVAGIEHWKGQLAVLCQEAAWLGRAPVFPHTAPLRQEHNFGVKIRRPLCGYLDVKNIEVLYRSGGARPEEPLALSSISEVELRALDIPPDEILLLPAGTPVAAEQNRRFRLIVRQITKGRLWRLQRAPLLREACALQPAPGTEQLAPEKETEVLQARLRSSAQVRELADEIIRQLPRGYSAVHVRRGDRLIVPAYRAWTSPEAVARELERAGLASDAPLYLMSDEIDRRWLRRMRRRRRFLHRADFPRLDELVRPPEPDNYFLFLVEREIMWRAARKFSCRSLDFMHDGVEMLLPFFPMKRFPRLWHPREITLRKILIALHYQRFYFVDLIPKTARMARISVKGLIALAGYCATRVFAARNLQKYRDRRRALNIPG